MTSPTGPQELADADKVDAAIQLLGKGDAKSACAMLMDVISRTPEPYIREFEHEGTRYIKFWDLEEFTHFVSDEVTRPTQKIVWLKCAYPRANYYMGFACVKLNEPATAVEFLDRGYQVEAHPIFLIEKGKALAQLKQHELAIASYQAAFDHPGAVRAKLRAMALRGKGVQLIDLKNLDEAEQCFETSLNLDPNNPVALNELKYIAQLRRGGNVAPVQTVTSRSQPMVCAICGEKVTNGGKVTSFGGRTTWRCADCAKKMPASGAGTPGLPGSSSALTITMMSDPAYKKRWWQFWKK